MKRGETLRTALRRGGSFEAASTSTLCEHVDFQLHHWKQNPGAPSFALFVCFRHSICPFMSWAQTLRRKVAITRKARKEARRRSSEPPPEGEGPDKIIR